MSFCINATLCHSVSMLLWQDLRFQPKSWLSLISSAKAGTQWHEQAAILKQSLHLNPFPLTALLALSAEGASKAQATCYPSTAHVCYRIDFLSQRPNARATSSSVHWVEGSRSVLGLANTLFHIAGRCFMQNITMNTFCPVHSVSLYTLHPAMS